MKKVIFCEGKHDSVFLENLFLKLGFHSSEVRIFNQKSFFQKTQISPKASMRYAETYEFRKFFRDDNKVLVKSEGGKGNTVPLFTEYLSEYVKEVEPILMLDLDSLMVKKKEIKKVLDDLNKKIMKGLNKDIIKIEWRELKESDLIYLIKGNLKNKRTQNQIGNAFYVILFAPSLEAVASEKVSGNENIKDKISKLSESPDVQDAFKFLKSNF